MPARTTDAGENGFFSVVAVTYFPGRGYEKTIQVNFLQRSTAYEYCDKFQDQIDSEGQPSRSYVIDKEGVPIRAGRCANLPANYFFQKHDPPKRIARRA